MVIRVRYKGSPSCVAPMFKTDARYGIREYNPKSLTLKSEKIKLFAGAEINQSACLGAVLHNHNVFCTLLCSGRYSYLYT